MAYAAVSLTVPAEAFPGEAVAVSAVVTNTATFNGSFTCELWAGSTLLSSSIQTLTMGSSGQFSASFTMPASNTTVLAWVTVWLFDHWGYAASASSTVIAQVPPTYQTIPFSVMVTNISARGELLSAAQLSVYVSAIAAGMEYLGPFTGTFNFSGGQGVTWGFNVKPVDYGNGLLTVHAQASGPSGVLSSNTKAYQIIQV